LFTDYSPLQIITTFHKKNTADVCGGLLAWQALYQLLQRRVKQPCGFRLENHGKNSYAITLANDDFHSGFG
jgi:hypothetical protein